jgi:hypothetical protein
MKLKSIPLFIRSIALIGAVAVVATGIWVATGVSTSQKTRNFQIEAEAVRNNNPAHCEDITGESYYFDPTDREIALTQTQAREHCRASIIQNNQKQAQPAP